MLRRCQHLLQPWLAIAVLMAPATAFADEMVLVGPKTITPGIETSFLVAVAEPSGAATGEQVTIRDETGVALGRSHTDATGRAIVSFTLPADTPEGARDLAFTTRHLTKTITLRVEPRADLLLTSDRTLYRPGQTIELRAIALDAHRRSALPDRELIFEVVDAGDRALLKQTVTTSEFGIAATTLPLSEDLDDGLLTARARIGSSETSRELRVEGFRLPRFLVEVETQEQVARPGLALFGTVRAKHLTGQPVQGGRVEITATTLANPNRYTRPEPEPEDRELSKKENLGGILGSGIGIGTRSGRSVGGIFGGYGRAPERANAYARIETVLDAAGTARFQIPAPDYIEAEAELGDAAVISLVAVVVDTGGHRERAVAAVPLTDDPLMLAAHFLHPPLVGVPSRLAVVAQDPRGAPVDVKATVQLPGMEPLTVETGPFGVNTIDVTLSAAGLMAVTASHGNRPVEWRRKVAPKSDGIALVIDRPLVKIGEPIEVELRAGTPGGHGDVILMAADGPVVFRRVSIWNRITRVELQPPAGVLGAVTIVAGRGGVQAQAQAVILDDAQLAVEITTKPEDPVPGADVEITTRVTDRAGQPAVAAIELAVLDSGIYALGGEGLTGREPAFRFLSEKMASALTRGPLSSQPDLSILASNDAAQRAMSYWLEIAGAEPIEMRAHHQSQERPPRVGLAGIGALLSGLPRPAIAAGFDRLSAVIALLLAALVAVWLVIRGRGANSAKAFATASLPLLTVVIGLTAWGDGYRAEPFVELEELEEPAPGFESATDPRRFPGTSPRSEDDRHIREPHERFAPSTPTVVAIGPDGISVNSARVVTLEDGKVAKKDVSAGGFLIDPLFERLDDTVDLLKRAGRYRKQSRFDGRVLLVVPDGANFRLLSQVMYTAGQAQYSRFTLVKPTELESVVPPSPGPADHEVLYLLLFAAVGLLLWVGRARLPSFVALGFLGVSTILQGAMRDAPPVDLTTMSFPLEDGLVGLHPWLGLLVGAAVIWEGLKSKRLLCPATATLPVLWVLLAVGLTQDFRLYFDYSGDRRVSAPAIGSAPAGDGLASDLGGTPTPRLAAVPVRRYFPETLTYRPLLISDADGTAQLELGLGHQVTTWKATALASSVLGAMGLGRQDIVATQDLQVEIDVPSRLTVGDHVAMPVAIYNHTAAELEVIAEIADAPWLKRAPPLRATVSVPARGATTAVLQFAPVAPGRHPLRITTTAGALRDAVEKVVTILPPSSLPETQVTSLVLSGDRARIADAELSPDLIAGTLNATLTLHQDPFTQVSAGLEGMLRLPWGCAEQTISSTLPNLLVLAYLRRTDQSQPEVEIFARENALRGYQRLLDYEEPGGGFSYYGDGDPRPKLAGYALEMLALMVTELELGQEVLDRTAAVVAAAITAQRAEGSSDDQPLGLMLGAARALRVVDLPGLRAALMPTLPRAAEVARSSDNPYLVARTLLILQELNVRGDDQRQLVQELSRLASRSADGLTHWTSRRTAFMWWLGAEVETTALAAQGILRAGQIESAQRAIAWLIGQRRGDHRWISSHDSARVLATLMELLTVRGRASGAPAWPALKVNGRLLDLGSVEPNDDGRHTIDVTGLVVPGNNRVELVDGVAGDMVAVLQADYRVPWSRARARPADSRLSLMVTYGAKEVALHRTIPVQLTVNNRGAVTDMLTVRYHIPGGFTVDPEGLEALVRTGGIDRFELGGADLVIYLDGLGSGGRHQVAFELRAEIPVNGEAPGAVVQDYYNPESRDRAAATRLSILPTAPRLATAGKGAKPTVELLPYEELLLEESPPSRRWTGSRY